MRHEPTLQLRIIAASSVGRDGFVRSYGRRCRARPVTVGVRWFAWSPLAAWGARAVKLRPWVVASEGAERVEFA